MTILDLNTSNVLSDLLLIRVKCNYSRVFKSGLLWYLLKLKGFKHQHQDLKMMVIDLFRYCFKGKSCSQKLQNQNNR